MLVVTCSNRRSSGWKTPNLTISSCTSPDRCVVCWYEYPNSDAGWFINAACITNPNSLLIGFSTFGTTKNGWFLIIHDLYWIIRGYPYFENPPTKVHKCWMASMHLCRETSDWVTPETCVSSLTLRSATHPRCGLDQIICHIRWFD